jgi:hypothetical protein
MENELTVQNWKTINDVLNLDDALVPIVQQMRRAGIKNSAIVASVRTAAQRMFYIAAGDVIDRLGVDVPEYARADRQLRKLVDVEAGRLAVQICKAAGIE